MATHSSTLAWRIPWMEEPGRLQSMGLQSQTWLNDFTFTFHFHALEKEMATHSSVLAWRMPGTEEPGGLPSMGSHRVGHDWSDLAAAAAAGTSLVVQGLRLHAPNVGGPGLILSLLTRSQILWRRVCLPQIKIPHAEMQVEDQMCHNKDLAQPGR